MLTGEHKSKIARVWETFWSNGISNPLVIIEQLSYLLFMKELDDRLLAEEGHASPLFKPDQQHLRWSHLRLEADPERQLANAIEAFALIKNLHGPDADTAFARHMKTATFRITSPQLLAEAVKQVDGIQLKDRDTKGDLYEHMLNTISQAGTNGQFRTPRHIIQMMVDLVAPCPTDIICDPACGTAGFLVAAHEHLITHHPEAHAARHKGEMFHGFDFDSTMLRIASMNLLMHGVERPVIEDRDALHRDQAHIAERYTLILANPPFKGSLDLSTVAPDLLKAVGARQPSDRDTKKKRTPKARAELLFIAMILRALKKGGRAAVIVPGGVLFASSKAHRTIRQTLVEDHKLEAVISMPSGVFKPYAGVATAILLFTRTETGGTDHVWFYDMQADGFSLDDKRQAIDDDDIPDLKARFRDRDPAAENDRTSKAFFVAKDELKAQKYDLSINRYKERVYEELEYDPPSLIIARLRALEAEIARDLDALEGMLG